MKNGDIKQLLETVEKDPNGIANLLITLAALMETIDVPGKKKPERLVIIPLTFGNRIRGIAGYTPFPDT